MKERPPQSKGQLFCSALHQASTELSANLLSLCSFVKPLTSRRKGNRVWVECAVLRGGKASEHRGKQKRDERMHDDNVKESDNGCTDAYLRSTQRCRCFESRTIK